MRKRIGRLIVAGVIAMCLGAISPDQAQACSCGGSPPPEAEFKFSSGVFVGEVISSRDYELPLNRRRLSRPLVMRVAVEESWKGVDTPEVDLITNRYGASCGLPLPPGSRYLFYTYESEDNYFVSYCSGSKPVDEAEDDLAFLASKKRLVHQGPTAAQVPLPIIALVAITLIALLSASKTPAEKATV